MFRQITVLNDNPTISDPSTKKSYALSSNDTSKLPITGSRSRISSLSNLIANVESSAGSNNNRSEKIGIRKFARNLVSGWAYETNQDGKILNNESLNDNKINNNDDNDSETNDFETNQLEKLLNSTQTLKIGSKRERKPLGDNRNISNISHENESNKKVLITKEIVSNKNKRELILSGFPKNVGVNTILQYISGGLLEKIVPEVFKKGDDCYINRLYICFIKPEDAKEFYEFSKTGLFIVCGENITAKWLPDSIPKPTSFLKDSDLSENTINSEINSGASRCLIMKKGSAKKPKQKKKSLRPHYPNFDFQEIRDHFSQYGHIVEITPAISQRLGVIIHFYDIRSAILVKKEIETPDTLMNQKYNSWSVRYAKDPADFACINL